MTIQDITLDTQTVSRDRLNIKAKTRSNLFSWNGQFSPLLVSVLLETYSCCGDFVLDSFVGSGTVLVEAGRRHLRAFGAEINPAAYLMSQTYSLINTSLQDRNALLQRVSEQVEQLFGTQSLFRQVQGADTTDNDPKAALIRLLRSETVAPARCLIETLIIMSDFYKTTFSDKSIMASWSRLLSTVQQLPYSLSPVTLSLTDARDLPLPAACIDLVITSPPYINVFNYHQQYRASAEALGWDLLHVAKSEIGSNRKHRGNRFLTVIQYCLDIAQTLAELRRVCKHSARIIMVVGRESTIRGTRLLNGDIVSRIGTLCAGLMAEKRQERAFVNRYGETIYEDILHFRVDNTHLATKTSAVTVAEKALRSALKEAPEDAKSDIESALARSEQVMPSPLFKIPQVKGRILS